MSCQEAGKKRCFLLWHYMITITEQTLTNRQTEQRSWSTNIQEGDQKVKRAKIVPRRKRQIHTQDTQRKINMIHTQDTQRKINMIHTQDTQRKINMIHTQDTQRKINMIHTQDTQRKINMIHIRRRTNTIHIHHHIRKRINTKQNQIIIMALNKTSPGPTSYTVPSNHAGR